MSIGGTFGNIGSIFAGLIANAKGNETLCKEDPAKQVVHLKNASDAFKAFKAIQKRINSKIESIEQQIQSCFGNNGSDESSTEQNTTEQMTTEHVGNSQTRLTTSPRSPPV